jgi:dynein heavy chain
LYLFALIWSIGTTTDLKGKEAFDKWLRERMPKMGIEFPAERMVYDYKFDIVEKKWTIWFETVKEYNVDIKMSYNEIVVPTLDSIRMKYFTAQLLTSGKHVLLPGPTGTGKSVNTSELLTYELPEGYQTLTMTFSA